jgi:uncharacterized protein (DUF1015 family)
MALLKPFRALRYDTGTAGPLNELVAPPHDVIPPRLERRLRAASPYNAVRLVRPHDPVEAARLLAGWRAEGILVREERSALWLLEETFVRPDGVRCTRRGIVARVRLAPYSAGIVLPHEETFSRQKKRRLELLRAVRTKLSPILMLHEGHGPEPAGEPRFEAELDGVRSRLWSVEEPEEIERVLGLVRGRLLIADGHHRYETALRFHEEDGSEETAHVLAVLVAKDDEGLTILPTHRLTAGAVPDLDGRFQLVEVGEPEAALAALAGVPQDRGAFVLLRRDGATLVEAEQAELDTALVDGLALERVSFTASVEEAERAVAAGTATAAFLVRPPTVAQVEAVAFAGERMPPKSTYFFPKLTCGLLFSPFDE